MAGEGARSDEAWLAEIVTGVPVSDVVDRQGPHRFVVSIYFSDPSNNPLEIATLDRSDPAWNGYDFTTWFRDATPPPALFETGTIYRGQR